MPKTTVQGGTHAEGRAPRVPFILIVDDDKCLRDTLQYLLTQEFPHCRISSAGDLTHALILANKDRPSLLLLDYHLQQGTGIDIFDALHPTGTKRIPTLVISANAPAAPLETRQLPLLPKPYDLDELYERVAALLT